MHRIFAEHYFLPFPEKSEIDTECKLQRQIVCSKALTFFMKILYNSLTLTRNRFLKRITFTKTTSKHVRRNTLGPVCVDDQPGARHKPLLLRRNHNLRIVLDRPRDLRIPGLEPPGGELRAVWNPAHPFLLGNP